MANTPNYNLEKPVHGTQNWDDIVNNNFNIIDETMKNNSDDIQTQILESTGYGVISGLSVMSQSTPNMSVLVKSGLVYMPNGQRINFPTDITVPITTADTTRPRTDIVYINSNGVISYLASSLGTAAVAGSETYTINTNAVAAIAGSNTYTLNINFVANDTVTFGGVTFTATSATQDSTHFIVGSDMTASMNNLSTALNANSTINAIYTSNSASGVMSITEKVAGGGHTPGSMTVVGTGTITVGTAINSKINDTITINGTIFTAVNSGASGNQFNIGVDTTTTATNLKNVLNANSTINALYTVTSSTNIITLTEKIAGGGNTPTLATVTGTVVITNGTIKTSTAQIYPSAPSISTGNFLLCQLTVGGGVSSITQSNITDKRIFKQNNNELTSQMAEITVNVKDFGAKDISESSNFDVDNPDTYYDSTNAFLQAIATGKPVLVPETSNYYKITAPIPLVNNIEFRGFVRMFGGNGDGTHAVLKVTNFDKNKPLVINNPLIDGGWDSSSSVFEYDHAIEIRGSRNVFVNGGYLKNLKGDGICISATLEDPPRFKDYSENIYIKDTIIENSYRNLISFISAKHCIVDNVAGLKLNNYVSGFDFEPNHDCTLRLDNIKVLNTTITADNIYCVNFFAGSSVQNIILDKCTFNSLNSYGIRRSVNDYSTISNVIIKDCEFNCPSKGDVLLFDIYGKLEFVNNKIIKSNLSAPSYLASVKLGAIDYLNIENMRFIARDTPVANLELQSGNILILENSIVDSNRFYTPGLSGSVEMDAPKIIFNNNSINDFEWGVKLKSSVKNLIAIGNHFTGKEATAINNAAFVIDSNTNIINMVLSNGYINSYPTVGIDSTSIYPKTSPEIVGNKIYYGTDIPTSGTYKKGDRLMNTNPTVGNPKSWICTVAGTPGTWVSEGNL